jgi:hypothetical protein
MVGIFCGEAVDQRGPTTHAIRVLGGRLNPIPVGRDHAPNFVGRDGEERSDAFNGLGRGWAHSHVPGASPGAIVDQVVPPCGRTGVVATRLHVDQAHLSEAFPCHLTEWFACHRFKVQRLYEPFNAFDRADRFP